MTPPATPYLDCPHCGTPNRSDQTTCYACKKPLDTPPLSEADGVDISPAATYLVTCPNCRRRVRLKADAYRRVKAGETAVRCPQCTAALDVSSARAEAAGTAAASVSAPSHNHSGLHGLGWSLVFVGAMGLIIAFFMETTIESGSSYGGYGSDRVHNLGLLVRQVVVSISAGLTLVAGAVFVAAGYLSDLRESALGSRRR